MAMRLLKTHLLFLHLYLFFSPCFAYTDMEVLLNLKSSMIGPKGHEYAYTLKVDEKSDVYSFGVVLLELIAGKKPVGEFGEGVDIVRWVRNTEEEITQPSDAAIVVAIVDPRLTGYPLTSVIHVFKIAMMCVEEEAAARPTMREVVHMLTNPPKSVANLIAF
ncbi:unnamed protein product [Arabidopsis thaliana]|uniref:(thale cress) hypothetical protein n=1 Tax=Arabidopsis thaliana TaxID=3702 RepID=A0A7G2E385_ARATH|nr:unnamed protein product [Arabidopsis thaliana]